MLAETSTQGLVAALAEVEVTRRIPLRRLRRRLRRRRASVAMSGLEWRTIAGLVLLGDLGLALMLWSLGAG